MTDDMERLKKVEEIVRDHFYSGPLAGSTARLTKALDEYIGAELSRLEVENERLRASALAADEVADQYEKAHEPLHEALAEANEARSLLQKAVLDRTAERDEAKAECDLLQEVLDGRPAINAALPDSYIRWSQGVMSGDVIRALLSKGGEGEGEDGGPCAICSDPEDDGPCPEHRPAPATAAIAWEREQHAPTIDPKGPTITHAQLCRLSQAFNRVDGTHDSSGFAINEWLKHRIALAAEVAALSSHEQGEG